jgi:hypothetical protein
MWPSPSCGAPRSPSARARSTGRSPSTWTCRAVVLGDGSARPFARERLGRGEPASIGLGLLGVLAARGGGHRRCRCGRRAACLASAACGGGCPFAFGAPPGAGDCVLDLGCGGGHDLAIASKLVGPSGTVFGIDLTQPMLDRTAATRREVRRPPAAGQRRADLSAPPSTSLRRCPASRPLPLTWSSAMAFSTSSSTSKRGFDAAFHCTKPGGRFLLTDVVIDEAAAAQAEAEADCAAPS